MIINYIASALGILGGAFVSFQSVYGFWIWLGGNALWMYIGYRAKPKRDWGMIAMFAFYQAISINGILQWR